MTRGPYHCGACGERLELQDGVWFHTLSGDYEAHEADPVHG